MAEHDYGPWSAFVRQMRVKEASGAQIHRAPLVPDVQPVVQVDDVRSLHVPTAPALQVVHCANASVALELTCVFFRAGPHGAGLLRIENNASAQQGPLVLQLRDVAPVLNLPVAVVPTWVVSPVGFPASASQYTTGSALPAVAAVAAGDPQIAVGIRDAVELDLFIPPGKFFVIWWNVVSQAIALTLFVESVPDPTEVAQG